MWSSRMEGWMAKSVGASVFYLCASITLLTAISACTAGPKTVTRDDVAKQISEKMTDNAGNKPDTVSCPDDLKPAVGATLVCEMTVKGSKYDVNVTVTSIDGDTAKFDMVRHTT
jgi:hypothetical protein